jgi:hypothetical protein
MGDSFPYPIFWLGLGQATCYVLAFTSRAGWLLRFVDVRRGAESREKGYAAGSHLQVRRKDPKGLHTLLVQLPAFSFQFSFFCHLLPPSFLPRISCTLSSHYPISLFLHLSTSSHARIPGPTMNRIATQSGIDTVLTSMMVTKADDTPDSDAEFGTKNAADAVAGPSISETKEFGEHEPSQAGV